MRSPLRMHCGQSASSWPRALEPRRLDSLQASNLGPTSPGRGGEGTAVGIMRARAGDPPRTMAQKILAGRTDEASLFGDLVQVKVDQVVLAREPNRVLGKAVESGLRKAAVEV